MSFKDVIKLILINLGLIVVHAIISFLICLVGIGFNALVFNKLPNFTVWAIVFFAIIILAEVFYYVYAFKSLKAKKTALHKANEEGAKILAEKEAEKARVQAEAKEAELDKREEKK